MVSSSIRASLGNTPKSFQSITSCRGENDQTNRLCLDDSSALGYGCHAVHLDHAQHDCGEGFAFAVEDVGGEQALHCQSFFQRRRDESGHRQVCFFESGPRRKRILASNYHWHASGISPGTFRRFHRTFDPVIQVLRPISPLAWLPLGLVIFRQSEPAAIFTIVTCAMWPTVINTGVGVRSISPEYLNVGKVIKLSPIKTLG